MLYAMVMSFAHYKKKITLKVIVHKDQVLSEHIYTKILVAPRNFPEQALQDLV